MFGIVPRFSCPTADGEGLHTPITDRIDSQNLLWVISLLSRIIVTFGLSDSTATFGGIQPLRPLPSNYGG